MVVFPGGIPCRRKGQPTPVFLTGESHGQRSLAGYSPWGHKESDMTEQWWYCCYQCHCYHHRHPRGQREPGMELGLF